MPATATDTTGEEALYRLQQILFGRELRVPLDQIRRMVDSPDFDVLAALGSHGSALQAEAGRIKRLVRMIDVTTQHLRGKGSMSHKQLFKGFTDEEQEKMAEEAAQRWDSDTVRESNARWKQYPPERKQRILNEGNSLHTDLIAAMAEAPSSPEVQEMIARWHEHLQHFWSPNDEQLLGLADSYDGDPRFLANFEGMRPGVASFMREAILQYVKSRK
ncbi:MAG: TipAS antibiotic-recognition domain-containing protein [Chloroflexota bacterium]